MKSSAGVGVLADSSSVDQAHVDHGENAVGSTASDELSECLECVFNRYVQVCPFPASTCSMK